MFLRNIVELQKKDLFVSFIANFIKAGLSAVTSFLIARNLGPDDTGRIFFLLFSFASFKGLFDLGTSSAFFTFLSKENQSARFINIFFLLGFHTIYYCICICCIHIPESFFSIIWLNEDRFTVILAFVASFMLIASGQSPLKWLKPHEKHYKYS